MGDFTGRIDQLDAIDLDKELGQHFNGQLKEAVKYLPEIWLVKILPELEVILELSFHYLTFFSNNSSVGQRLLGLRIKERFHSRLELGLKLLSNFDSFLFNSKEDGEGGVKMTHWSGECLSFLIW